MGIFNKEEQPVESVSEAPAPKKKKPSSRSTSRSTQIVSAPIPQPGLFYNTPAPAAYNAPRSLTAAAAQVKTNDKGEYEQFKARRSASSSAWQAELAVLLALPHGRQRLGSTTTLLARLSTRSTW